MRADRCYACGAEVLAWPRWPHRVCDGCPIYSTAGRQRKRVEYFVEASGKVAARYLKSGRRFSRDECFVEDHLKAPGSLIRCWAGDDRAGGIVVTPLVGRDGQRYTNHLYAHDYINASEGDHGPASLSAAVLLEYFKDKSVYDALETSGHLRPDLKRFFEERGPFKRLKGRPRLGKLEDTDRFFRAWSVLQLAFANRAGVSRVRDVAATAVSDAIEAIAFRETQPKTHRLIPCRPLPDDPKRLMARLESELTKDVKDLLSGRWKGARFAPGSRILIWLNDRHPGRRKPAKHSRST